ncbi:hypothetical protein [Bradyrhizobium sp. 76]|uniref:hypothetical protein n=1 Tax=Bradyrhizobium sp. 76 TaxID=2782680 RepID=UPI001FF90E32|nr:hypothetical protein [Bradyrhizobium sp. 76]MCK1406134.1 hypothetical protein [Bradyrhizobium sp. 76]
MDEEFCRERLRVVRDLAAKADPFVKRRLLQLAQHYERRISIARGVTRHGRGFEERGINLW